MGQTLTHGVYLPDEGERNCYNGLAGNWQILDTSVGTIAEHTSQIAGKAPLVHTHTKSDVTDLLNSNFIPSANNSYDLGSSSYQWNNLYAKGYYYNGVAWGLDKENVWNAWQTQEKTNTNALIRLRRADMKLGDEPPSSGYKELGGYTFAGSDNVNMSIISFRDLASGDTLLRFIARQKYDNNGNRSATGTIHESGIDIGIDSSRNKYCRPLTNNTTDLGTSTAKWKSLNGINPGALSLPSISNTGANAWIEIDTRDWVKSAVVGTAQKYTPLVDGWLNVRVDNATVLAIAVVSVNYMHQMVRNETANSLALLLPVFKNREVAIMVGGNENLAYNRVTFYPCQGNV